MGAFHVLEKKEHTWINIDLTPRQEKKDKYLENIPSITKTLTSFHAKDDCPEAREKVFKIIKSLNYSLDH